MRPESGVVNNPAFFALRILRSSGGLCRTPLVKMWRERFVDRYDLGAEVLTMGMLSQPNFAFEEERYQNKQLVLLDELHNFRHSDSLLAAEPAIICTEALL
jgi:hypothetical protein